jgi:hypothetical protein
MKAVNASYVENAHGISICHRVPQRAVSLFRAIRVSDRLRSLAGIAAPLKKAEQLTFVVNLVDPIQRPSLLLSLSHAEGPSTATTIEGLRPVGFRSTRNRNQIESAAQALLVLPLFTGDSFPPAPAAVFRLRALYTLLQRPNDRLHCSALRLL